MPRSAITTSPSRAWTPKGRRYHALNPDVFYWAHSTFFVGTIHVAERFFGGITEAEKRQLFDEHITWYRMYGMSMRPVPETWEDFQVYWDHMCREVLEDNRATRDVLDLAKYPKPPFTQWMPDLAVVADAATPRRAVHGVVDPSGCTTRRCVNYWATPGRTAMNGCTGDSAMWFGWCSMRCPWRLRKHPRARAGWDRATGRIPADTPLVHTPARNLPPLDKRGDPMHYCPRV